MVKTTATIFGLALIAFSIWFNTDRYPVVWRMVNPESAVKTTENTAPRTAGRVSGRAEVGAPPAATKQAATDDDPADRPATIDSAGAAAGSPEGIGYKIGGIDRGGRDFRSADSHAEDEQSVGYGESIAAATAADGRADETSATKPTLELVPVVLSRTPKAEPSEPSVRRLPPVDRPGPAAINLGGSIPVYPSTGIE